MKVPSIWGPGAALEIEVTDARQWRREHLGGAGRCRRRVGERRIGLGRQESTKLWCMPATVRAIRARPKRCASVYDPDPPEIHWGTETSGIYHVFQGEHSTPVAVLPDGRRGRRVPDLLWSRTRGQWRSVAAAEWTVERSVAPRFFLRAAARKARVYVLPGVSLPVTRKAGIGVRSNDALVGTRHLAFRLEESESGLLVVEAIDWLGNRSTVSWPLWSGRGGGALEWPAGDARSCFG